MALILSVSRSWGISGPGALINPVAVVFVAHNLSPTGTLMRDGQSFPSTMGRILGTQLAIGWGDACAALLK
jgi:hypothetical protein